MSSNKPSLLRFFERNKLNYSAQASSSMELPSSSFSKYCVFAENGFFQSERSGGQWWQVHFEIPVQVMSYNIKVSGCDPYVKSWSINVSMDGSTWKTIHTKSFSNSQFSSTIIDLEESPQIKYFRIIQLLNSNNVDGRFIFRYFDCFGNIILQTKGRSISRRVYVVIYSFLFIVLSNK